MGYTVAAFDDIMDSEESARPGTVEKINSFYTGTFMNRSNDVNNDVTIINMQRLRQGDLTDYVNENYGEEGWFNLVLPARYDVTRVFLSPIGYNDKRTYPGQLLDPIRLPDSFLHMQEKDRIIYNTRYQQDPSSGRVGTYIKKEWLHRVAELPTYFEKVVTVWDLSFDDKVGASYTVGLTGGIRKDKITLFDMFRNQVDIVRQVAAIKAMRDKLPQSEICLENKANGSAAKTLLRDQVPNIRHLDPAVYGGSKEARVMSILPYLHEHGLSVYDPSLLTAYSSTKHIPDETYDPGAIEDELVAFPLGRTSDIVDCVAYLTAILTHETSGSDIVITRGTKIKLFGEDFEVNGLPAERSHDPYDLFGEGLPTLNSIGEISW
jgi:phage terminase large subunit-like protein